MALIMGLGHHSIWATVLDSRSFTSPLNTSSVAVRSMPEQNARPDPVRIMNHSKLSFPRALNP
ncbi:hypothetical protein SLEP1_g49259 [Rubroshorea leprosula]|uniref:Uncharacterized protein n=1 Tax=Rubroshorea leprosula TaxID=152421 RepID=A0AAV5LZ93_9ROSI|nr:hypothetical protein SLEP1_g49259 [Rubroshorea leprosula]